MAESDDNYNKVKGMLDVLPGQFGTDTAMYLCCDLEYIEISLDQYDITTIPTVKCFKNGEVVGSQNGQDEDKYCGFFSEMMTCTDQPI